MKIRLTGSKNYRSGYGFEWRWLNGLLKSGEAKRGQRFFRSTGPRWVKDYDNMNDKGTDWKWLHAPVDVYWYGIDGKYHEDQCKIGTNHVGVIDTDEFLKLVMYSWENPDISVSLVSKQKGKKFTHIWTLNDREIT